MRWNISGRTSFNKLWNKDNAETKTYTRAESKLKKYSFFN